VCVLLCDYYCQYVDFLESDSDYKKEEMLYFCQICTFEKLRNFMVII